MVKLINIFDKRSCSKLSCGRLALISSDDIEGICIVKYWNFKDGRWSKGTKKLTSKSLFKNYLISAYEYMDI